MKKRKEDGGKLSDETEAQREWAKIARECGRRCVVALGADEAWIHICKYLGIAP